MSRTTLRIRLQQSLPDPTHSPFDSAPPRNATTSPSPAHMTLYHPPPLRSSSTNLSFANQLHLGSSPTPFLDHLHRPPHHRPAHTHPAYIPPRPFRPSRTDPSLLVRTAPDIVRQTTSDTVSPPEDTHPRPGRDAHTLHVPPAWLLRIGRRRIAWSEPGGLAWRKEI
jgi:hypothetical protein